MTNHRVKSPAEKQQSRYYVLTVFGGVSIDRTQAYASDEKRNKAAIEVYDGQDPESDSIFWLDVHGDGTVSVGDYGHGFFGEDEDDEELTLYAQSLQ